MISGNLGKFEKKINIFKILWKNKYIRGNLNKKRIFYII
jgi:hypothetical protein